MTTSTLAMFITIGGILHLAITSAGVVMTTVLDWRRNLAPLNALTRHVIWTHGGYVLLTIIGFGVVSIAMPRVLTSGEPLPRAVCGFIAVFWGIRLFIQFFVFDARPFLNNVFLKLAYHALTVVFSFFTVIYSLAAAIPRR